MSSPSALSARLHNVRDDIGRGFDTRLIAPLVLGAILNPVNSSTIAVALVPIGLALGASTAQTAWLVSGLYLATAVGQPVVGRLVDRYGVRSVYLGATALVGIAGFAGSVAPNLVMLVIARVVLGLGTCAGYPSAMALIRSEGKRTGVDSPSGILAILSLSAQTIFVIGPTLGGLLISAFGWRSVFLINVPLALGCCYYGITRLPKAQRADAATASAWRLLDVPGMTFFGLMLASAMWLLMKPSVQHLWLLGIVLISGAAFVWRELHVTEPFIDVRPLWANTPLLLTYARQLLGGIVSYSFIYGFTQWLETSRGLSSSQTGLTVLPMAVAAVVATAVTGRHAPVRGKLLVGAILQLVGCALVLTLHSGSSLLFLVAIAVVVGIPQGLLGLANQNALYHQADPQRIGSSAGLLRTFMYGGAILAAVGNAAAFGSTATTDGLRTLASWLLIVGGILLVLVLIDRSLGAIGRTASTQ